MATIGRLIAEIVADDSALQQGLNSATSATKKAAGDITSAVKGIAGAFAAYLSADLFIGFIKGSIDAAVELGKLSQQAGIAVESLSALKYAAALNGASIQDLDDALKGLANKMTEAKAGGNEAAVVFKAIGVAVTDASGNLRSSEDVLMDMADAFAGMEDGAGKAAISQKLMEDAGVALIPVLNQGRAGLEAYKNEARDLGIVVGPEMAKQAAEFNQNITKMTSLAEALGRSIANELMPSLNSLIQEFITGRKHATGFWDALRTFGTINPFKDLAGNLKSTRDEIDSLMAARARYIKSGADTSSIDAALETERKRLAYMLDIQRQQALLASGDDVGDAISRRMGAQAKQKAPDIAQPDPAAAKAAEDAKKQAAEVEKFFSDVDGKARQRDIDSLNKFLELLSQKEQKRADAKKSEQQLAEEEYAKDQELLLQAFENKLIAEEDYTAKLLELRMARDEALQVAHDNALMAEKEAADERVRINQEAEQMIYDARRSATDAAINLLSALGGQSKLAAIAAIALGKAVAIADIIRHTAVAQMHAMAQLGPIAGPPAAAKIGVMGKIQAGLVAATGLVQAASVGNGSASVGIPPSSTGAAASQDVQQPQASSPMVSQTITIRGITSDEMFSGASVSTLINKLIDAQRNGSKIVLA